MFRVLILLSAAALAGAAGHFSDGMKAFEKGKYGRARKSLARVIEVEKPGPLFDDALYWRARCFEEEGNKKEAKKNYLRLLRQCGEGEYVADALKRFIAAGGKRAEIIDRSTPEKMWKSFCRAVFDGDVESVLLCLGGEMKTSVKMVLQENPDSFRAEIFENLARMRVAKFEKKGKDRAILKLGLAGAGRDAGMFGLQLVKDGSGWIMEDTVRPNRAARRNVPPPPPVAEPANVDAANITWPDVELSAGQKKNLARLIGKLGSNSFVEREHATRQIVDMGPAAGRGIEKALEAGDPEVRIRARRIIRELAKVMADREKNNDGGTDESE